jgi:hypothetical protein
MPRISSLRLVLVLQQRIQQRFSMIFSRAAPSYLHSNGLAVHLDLFLLYVTVCAFVRMAMPMATNCKHENGGDCSCNYIGNDKNGARCGPWDWYYLLIFLLYRLRRHIHPPSLVLLLLLLLLLLMMIMIMMLLVADCRHID